LDNAVDGNSTGELLDAHGLGSNGLNAGRIGTYFVVVVVVMVVLEVALVAIEPECGRIEDSCDCVEGLDSTDAIWNCRETTQLVPNSRLNNNRR
jgi:hypothetical protein